MRNSRARPKPAPSTQHSRAGGIVSAIEPQERRDGRRCNVYLDGRYAFSLTTELAVQELHVGEAISEERYAALVVKDQQARCYDAALRFLGSRPRSEREIRDRLARHDRAGAQRRWRADLEPGRLRAGGSFL